MNATKVIARPVKRAIPKTIAVAKPVATKVALMLTQQEIAQIITALDWQIDTEPLMAKLGAELARTLIKD